MTDQDKAVTDRKLAKDVAKELDRRRWRRKILLWGALVGAIALAVMYGTCGAGWGIGNGKGSGEGSGPGSGATLATVPDGVMRRCKILLASTGISVDGTPATRDEAVARCKSTAGADVIVTGDTRQGEWDALRKALDKAGIEVFKRERRAPGDAGLGSD